MTDRKVVVIWDEMTDRTLVFENMKAVKQYFTSLPEHKALSEEAIVAA
jgi:hypothetical protein